MTGWVYGREWLPGLGRGKCQPGGTFNRRERGGRGVFLGELPQPETGRFVRSPWLIRTPRHSRCGEKDGGGVVFPFLLSLAAGRRIFRTHQPQFVIRLL